MERTCSGAVRSVMSDSEGALLVHLEWHNVAVWTWLVREDNDVSRVL